ncbi:MAG TPA: flavoprotein [Pirellulales bacterium]|jgi:phosphopantothenoylcysteine decarboxylase/phosphopantothenate--cysteine ligase|nr:flavoprotein [Pirellulales bacterium]
MNGRELVVGVTGGIAAYKVAALVSQLVQAGADVRVVMTRAAGKFIGPATFEALTGRPVPRSAFNDPDHPLGAHIDLADADLLCIAPATANFLAKAALGLADDLLSTLYLAFKGPVLMAPAMNDQMWSKPAVQRNIERLRADGVHFVGPEEGWLSCRTRGVGRMADPAQIRDAILKILAE